MLVVPLVFVSLVCGTSTLKDISTLGRLGGKTLAFYLTTTAIAITLALVMGNVFKPGAADLSAATTFASEAPSLGQVIIDMFPTNPISSMANGNTRKSSCSLSCSVLLSVLRVSRANIAGIFADLNEVIMKLVAPLMNIAPFGVFFLMAKLFTGLGLDAIFNYSVTSWY